MSIHSHHFPLSFNTSLFMHIHFKFEPNISPTQLTKHTKKNGYLIVVTQEPTIGSFVVATQEPAVRKNLAAVTQELAARKESFSCLKFVLSSFGIFCFYACGNYKSSMAAN